MRLSASRWHLGLVMLWMLLLVTGERSVTAVSPASDLDSSAWVGCPMAHCDYRMSDTVGLPPPGANAAVIWRDMVEGAPGHPLGSGKGLGCASNGVVAVCSFGEIPPDFPNTPCAADVQDVVISYRYAGGSGLPERAWSSGNLLNCTAFTSAPIVFSNGAVIAADNQRLVRFSPTGAVVWNTARSGGMPISPIITPTGLIVLATNGGPVSAFDPTTGAMLAQLDIGMDGARFVTINTPAARGNRVYVIMHHRPNESLGRLYALDLVSTHVRGVRSASLTVAWYLEVGGPAGASPLLSGTNLILIDGDRLTPGGPYAPHIMAVLDRGAYGEVVWVKGMPGKIVASFAADPRGGFWAYSTGYPPDNKMLSRFRFSDTNGDGIGEIVQQIDVDALVNAPGVHMPTSAMSVAGTSTSPVLVFGASAFATGGALMSTYVVALDPITQQKLWAVPLEAGGVVAGQFPIMNGPQGPRLIFTNQAEGAWIIGSP